MGTNTACGSEAASRPDAVRAPHEEQSNPRRSSQCSSKNISAYANSEPYASIELDSDDDGNASARCNAKIRDDEDFHPPFLSEGGHGSSDGDNETDENWTRLAPSAARLADL